MTIRSVYNPNDHSWSDVPNWSLRRLTRYWVNLLNWNDQHKRPQWEQEYLDNLPWY